ncbi:MarR family winged helix-turn-helix transcriptional regulator [Kibdelosporangium aridum]|uniref:MarR family winged helix-turn-helix transcriptional regulator n=1 Tax=Kibdelosporangium aridum TaxID=2030 RepID=UPI00068935C7
MATAEQDVDEQEFNDFVAASQTLFAMVRRSRGRLANQATGLSLSQLSLLEPVAVHGPLMVGQIAAYAGVAGPSATRMLKQLEAKGVVSRQRSTEDERKVLVALTPRGEELVVRHRSAVRAAQRDHFAKLMPQQRKVFVEVLNQMAAMVDAWAGVDPSKRPAAANR